MNKQPGTAGVMPIEGSGCGVRPSKEAMEVEFGVDFSKAKEFLESSNKKAEKPAKSNK